MTWYMPTVTSHDQWQRLVDHSRSGLLEPYLAQELLDTPSVPGFDGLVVGNLTGNAIAVAKWPALPRVAAVCVPEGTKLWFSSDVLVHWNACQLDQHLTHGCWVCHVDGLEHPEERVEEFWCLWYTTISYDIDWYHMIPIELQSHQLQNHHCINVYHVVSCCIMWYRTVSLDIRTFLTYSPRRTLLLMW